MDIQVRRPVARDFDALVNELNPQIIMRCVDCQTFFLPDEISIVKGRTREAGQPRTFVYLTCPVCHPVLEYNQEMVPLCEFVYLTREDYESTKSAERWGMVYDPKKKEFENPHKSLIVPN